MRQPSLGEGRDSQDDLLGEGSGLGAGSHRAGVQHPIDNTAMCVGTHGDRL